MTKNIDHTPLSLITTLHICMGFDVSLGRCFSDLVTKLWQSNPQFKLLLKDLIYYLIISLELFQFD